MPRRSIETLIALAAVVALALVLYNATLVDRRPPTLSHVSLSAKAGGDDRLAQTLTAIDLSFSEPVDRTSVEGRFRIDPYVGGTFTWDGSTTAIYTPARKLPPATEFAVSVDAGFTDVEGNPAPDASEPFVFRTIGQPVVLSMTPESGSTGVATDTVVRLQFDRLMDTGSVDDATTVVPAVGYRASWTGPDLTIAFDSPLPFGTLFTVGVGSDAADTDGSHLAAPFSGTFTTVAAGLGIETVVPAHGVAGIGTRTPIAIIFDGPIDPASVADAIRITPAIPGDVRVVALPSDLAPVVPPPAASGAPSGPPAVPATPTGPGSVLLFTPSSPLAAHTTYTVELAPVVHRSGDPGQVAAGRTWTFTTGGQTASAQNQVAFLSPRGGIRNVWLMNPDGSNPRQITTELAPVSAYDVSSDGRTIVYSAAGLVRALRLDSGDLATVTRPGLFEYGPVLTPDGKSILVGRRDATGADLGFWLEPVPGSDGSAGERQILADGAPPLGSSAFGSDGLVAGPGVSDWSRRAVFDPSGGSVLLVDGQGRVPLVTIDPGSSVPGAVPGAVYQQVTGPIGAPAWDPVRQTFVIVAVPPGGTAPGVLSSGRPSTPIVPAAGPVAVAVHGGLTTLTPPNGDHVGYTPAPDRPLDGLTSSADLLDRSPGFSPDGTTLLFGRVQASQPTRSAGIWLAGLDGRDLRQLSTDGTAPRWLP
jgi:hypothetical protein